MADLPHVASGDPHAAAHNAERDRINTNASDVSKRIPLPTNPQVGDLLRFNGSAWVSAKTRLFEGVGSPEGVVAAPIGSRYVDYAATNGAVEWLKKTGTNDADNNGWMLLAADTGLRNISGLITKGTNGVVTAAFLRRQNDLVDLYIDLKNPSSLTGFGTLYTLGLGFRPPFTRLGLIQDNNETACASTSINTGGGIQLISPVVSKQDQYNGTWLTKDPWPTSLPGTAA